MNAGTSLCALTRSSWSAFISGKNTSLHVQLRISGLWGACVGRLSGFGLMHTIVSFLPS